MKTTTTTIICCLFLASSVYADSDIDKFYRQCVCHNTQLQKHQTENTLLRAVTGRDIDFNSVTSPSCDDIYSTDMTPRRAYLIAQDKAQHAQQEAMENRLLSN